MSNIICLVFGVLIGAIIVYIAYHDTLKSKDTLIDDYKKGIEIHNKRELRLIFINQSTKDYVKKQQNIIKSNYGKNEKPTTDDTIAAGYYSALKDVEKTITQLEKNSEDLITKE
jgi:hypothetical protein